MRSERGSRPKMASDRVTEPDSLPSSDVTFNSISRALPFLADRDWRGRRIVGELELAGLRHAVRQSLLYRIAHRDPAAFDAGHGALDKNQTARNVGLPDLEVERSHPVHTEMTGHLFVLKSLAGIRPTTGRTDRAMRNRHAVAGAQAAEIPALHTAGPALAGRSAGDID